MISNLISCTVSSQKNTTYIKAEIPKANKATQNQAKTHKQQTGSKRQTNYHTCTHRVTLSSAGLLLATLEN